MASKKDYQIPKGRLFRFPVPPTTRTYKPVSHKSVHKSITDAIKEVGWTVEKEEFFSTNGGLMANARYVIKEVKDEDMALEIGWQNCYNKRFSLKFAIGTHIFICGNGCVSGDMGAFKKRHTSDIAEISPEYIRESIFDAESEFEKLKLLKEEMKMLKVSKAIQAEIIGELFLFEEILKPTQIVTVKEELANPSFDYGAPNSLWELYQHVTNAIKSTHPESWADTHIEAHKYFKRTLSSFMGI